jgi:uncharacterized membrane protein
MTDAVLFGLTLVSALGCGLVAGVFFAFSTFVMKALARLPPVQGIAAMQSINRVVINSWFMAPFLGTAVACVILAGASLVRWDGSGTAWLLGGSLLYLAGTLLVTIMFNVPRNDALAAVDPAGAGGDSRWVEYLTGWTAWNHVRTLAAVAAAVSLTIAL